MSDIAICDTNIQEQLEVLQEEVVQLRKKKDLERSDLRVAEDCIRKLETHFQTFQLELHAAEDTRFYQEKLEDYMSQFMEFKRDISVLKGRTERGALLGDAKPAAGEDRSQWGNEQHADYVERMGQQNLDIVDEIKQDALQAREGMTAVAEDMVGQTGQIVRIGEEVDQIEDVMTRVNRLLRAIAKRLFTDKLIQIMTLIVLLGIVAIIVLSIALPDNTNFTVPDELKPPTSQSQATSSSSSRRLLALRAWH
mmetsp:Transcript_22757/g.73224  ORF Transcript_22757/g.73224 Transcript_22757/m.73224 type:complete len:252 (-) Transcript_22757:203-958(-)|eukprot:CAMPEP_0196782288 /NCGR_PEP_ID=MMETSP1104-20130614/11230_1 /TAXON_ID=33652 /ORGANISM="Cafeteria sp., Strain Caron Lab Isolate" /LENGTH=251 /DNA_ID=CAMNT_0042152521 /DNA_START=13 /DNA_END=768 /DNA_ORIENTATION=+